MAAINLETNVLGYRENDVAVPLADGYTLSGLDGVRNFSGYTITAQLSNSLESDRLAVVHQGLITREGRRLLFNRVPIGEFSGGFGSQPLTIQLAGDVSRDAVQILLQQIRYSNVSDSLVSGDRLATLTLAKPGSETATGSRSIAVTGVDDTPIAQQALTLYDGSSGVVADRSGAAPDGPWLFYQDSTAFLDGEASRETSGGKTTLSSDNEAFAGLSNYDVRPRLFPLSITSDIVNPNFPVLDRTQGYTLSFSAKLLNESFNPNSVDEDQDGRNDHAGFNVILLSSDTQGIELSFERNAIWADEDGRTQVDPSKEPDQSPRDNTRTFFTQAEGTVFDTTRLTEYDLTVLGDRYQLSANDQPILSGKLRDYSTFQPDSFTALGQTITPPDPYETPNLVFLGDNTPAAGATVEIASVEISTALNNGSLPLNSPTGNQPQLRIEDPDSDDAPLTATLTASSGNITINNSVTGGVSSSQISGNGTGQLTLTGSSSQINTTLDAGTLSYSSIGNGDDALQVAIAPATSIPPEQIGNLSVFSRTAQTTIQNGIVQSQPLQPSIQDDNWQLQVSGQFSGSEAVDLVWQNVKTGQVVLWEDENIRAIELPRVSASQWAIAGTGFFNADTNEDLLWYDAATQQVAVWYMDGQGGVSDRASLTLSGTVANQLQGYEIEGSGDFDGNGSTELLWVNTAGDVQISGVENGAIASPASFAAPLPITSTTTIQGIGDYNGDNRDDLALGQSGNVNAVSQIWLMNGTALPEVLALGT